jgi:hypothetical protein
MLCEKIWGAMITVVLKTRGSVFALAALDRQSSCLRDLQLVERCFDDIQVRGEGHDQKGR